MEKNATGGGTERDDTDDSLRVERQKTDGELERRRSQIEEDADGVVQLARDRADARLQTARSRADADLQRAGATVREREAVRAEHAEADAVLSGERAEQSEELTAERARRAQALAELLGLEREETDAHLQIERQSSDGAVAARDEFLGMVSHDLRTLLGGIALQAAMQLRDAGASEGLFAQLAARARKIQQYTARMNRLIGDLVDVASIEAGQMAVAAAELDATSLIRETIETFQAHAAARGIALSGEGGTGALLARYDHGRILQVLANLVSNALKFTPEGGRVVVGARESEGEVRFSVSDTGSGIAREHLEHVFERFWQVRRNDRRGVGLGLFISRCIVDAHGGRIWAESDAGAGTRVFFTLPRGGVAAT